MTVHTRTELVLDSADRLKAIADESRAQILRILEDGPASAKELGELTGMSHGKVGHHLKVLREAGFIDLVEEKPVRAVVERFYGLAYDRLRFAYPGVDRLQFVFGQAALEASANQPFEPPGVVVTVRLKPEQASRFHQRLMQLAEEFEAAEEADSTQVFGFAGSVFLTETPQRGKA